MNIQAFLILIFWGLAFSGCATPPNQTKGNAPVETVASDPSDTPANVKVAQSDATPAREISEEPVLSGDDSPVKSKTQSKKGPEKPAPVTTQTIDKKASATVISDPNASLPEKKTENETPAKVVQKPAPSVPKTPKVVPPPTPNPIAFSHSVWDGLLKKHVSGSGRVNYKGFVQDKAKHQEYLDLLSKNPPKADWKRNEKLAFWINAYNAFTIKLITDNYPLKSITDLGKPWDKAFISIGGSTYTLNQIENEIIRPRFNEPRIHFAVNCAAKSCPPLLNEAFMPESLNSQLGRMTRKFIQNESSNQISEKKVALSKIFEWYKEDFTKKGSLIDYINTYSAVKADENAEVSFKEYDWSLNE